MSYEPGTYRKGDTERVAKDAKQAVALVFDGFKRVEDPAPAEEPVVEAQPKADEPVKDEPASGEATPAVAARPRPPKQKD